MASPENKEPLRITAEDLATVTLPEPVVPGAMLPAQFGAKNYGSIADAADQGPAIAEDKGSILLPGWFSRGVAGFLGTLSGWAIIEPCLVDYLGVHPGLVRIQWSIT